VNSVQYTIAENVLQINRISEETQGDKLHENQGVLSESSLLRSDGSHGSRTGDLTVGLRRVIGVQVGQLDE
jgi:hypothetical protein